MDSMVLLHSMVHWYRRQNFEENDLASRIMAIHVHHGLSVNADQWAEFCQLRCDELQVPLRVHRVHLELNGNGVEQAARQARYRVFELECGAGDVLLMGHHGDDQIETRMMRLTRGSGLSGLAGIPVRRRLSEHSEVELLRPFLGLRRRILQAYANDNRLTWVEDESNQDTRFERNWWRKALLPRIERRFPGRLEAMLASTQALQSDAEALDFLLAPYLENCCTPCHWPWVKAIGLKLDQVAACSIKIRPALLRSWLDLQQVQAPSMVQLEQIIQMFTATAGANPEVQLGQWMIRRHQGQLLICDGQEELKCKQLLAGKAASVEALLPAVTGVDESRTIEWLGRQWSAKDISPGSYQVSCLALMDSGSKLTLRPNSRPRKRLKHLWQEIGVPPWLRPLWPLLFQHGELRAIPEVAVDDRNLAR